jgi:hypothetical protein
MPVEKLVGYAALLVTGWYLALGPNAALHKIHEVQWAILRDVGSTRSWGYPSRPFRYKTPRYLQVASLAGPRPQPFDILDLDDMRPRRLPAYSRWLGRGGRLRGAVVSSPFCPALDAL